VRAKSGRPNTSRGGTLHRRVGAVLAVLIATALASAVVVGLPNPAGAAGGASTPIVVGGDGDLSLAAGISQGFQAGIVRFNKSGGLGGRKIKYVGFLDDGLSANTNLTNAQQLVENKGVMAVAPFDSEVATGSTGTYLAGAKVPMIGWATGTAFASAPLWSWGINGFQTNYQVIESSSPRQILAALGQTSSPGRVKLAIIGLDYASVKTADQNVKAAATMSKIKVVYDEAPIAVIGTTNYAPYAQAIVASGANAVYQVLGASDAVGLAAALKSLGWKGSIFNGVTYFPGQLSSQPNEAAALNGVFVQNEFPANENATPAVKQEEKDLTAVGAPPELTSGTSIGYWSAILLEQILRATLKSVGGNPSKVTSQTMEKSVNAGFTYTDPIAGGIGSEYFPVAETFPSGCSTMVKVVGYQYRQTSPFQCLPVINIKTGKQVNLKTGKIES
jgi:ABC-type branched-subunit amino acid transport system substrate-binding protein